MMARIRKSAEEKDQGFTLIELLVVMIIIGILAAIAVPVFLNQRTKAVDTSIKSDIRTVAQNVETTYVDTQAYPASAVQSGVVSGVNKITVSAVDTVLSSGNVVLYKPITNGYCLLGTNPKASTTGTVTTAAADTGTFFAYNSTTGGLRTGAAATAAAAGC